MLSGISFHHQNSSPAFKYLLFLICFQSVLALSLLLCNPGNSYAGKTDSPVIYIVKRGDTLSEIALTYKVSVGQLRRWNRLRGDKIFEGQRLKLWPHGSSLYYVVRSGDTLSEIAAQCGVSIGDDLEYADEITLGRSIINRTLFEPLSSD